MTERNALEVLEWRTRVARAFRRYVRGVAEERRDELLRDVARELGRGYASVKNWAEGDTVPPAPAAAAVERFLKGEGVEV